MNWGGSEKNQTFPYRTSTMQSFISYLNIITCMLDPDMQVNNILYICDILHTDK